LQIELKEAARNFPGFRADQSIVLFTFRADDDGADGIAARVIVMKDIGNADELVEHRYVTQARKRAEGGNATGKVNFTSTARRAPTTAELKARVLAGEGTQSIVHTNSTYASMSDVTGQTMHMPRMVRPYRWDREDREDLEDAEEDARLGYLNMTIRSEADNVRSVRSRDQGPQVPRSIPEHIVTPLLKRATAQDLQAARTIVKNALAESSKLNKARVASPLRNNYGLKPGTEVGAGRVPGAAGSAATNQEDVPPLLVISDQIAAAAALVAEADAVSGSRNVTKRAEAAAGTYWMQRWVFPFPTKYAISHGHQRTPC
jgi:hypothetical protein